MFHGKLLYKAVRKIVVRKFFGREPKSKLDGAMREEQGGEGTNGEAERCRGVYPSLTSSSNR